MPAYILRPPQGAVTKRRRVGRGQGSGLGTTAGKGSKGQQSRSGGKTYPGFEGGQMPLYRRIPHRGFSNVRFAKPFQLVTLAQLSRYFTPGQTVDSEALCTLGLVKKSAKRIKVLANGRITKALTLQVDKVSDAAKDKIEKAGGRVLLRQASSVKSKGI